MENFEKMIKETGYGRAVVAFEEHLSKEFWDSLTIKQCIKICLVTTWNSELRKKAFSRMEKLGATFEQWLELYYKASWGCKLDDKLREIVLSKRKRKMSALG